ncbi:MAG: PEP/pyruvate-binding domain-containing protein [Anaerolineales bacterium]
MSPLILPLPDPQATLASVGGKGMSLARLARAGLPVPGGFHITTEAYRHFVSQNGLQPRIMQAREGVDASDPACVEPVSRRIAGFFVDGLLPADIVRAVSDAYAELSINPSALSGGREGANPIPVAVRSSATAEDLPEASFAGQQDTYLNITGATAVLDAVKRCWASLCTARAIAYRARQGIAPESVALAVVVQQLVFSETSGVMFTANPVNGAWDEIVIDASWGLGEAIVGGLVSPDHIVLDKTTGKIKSLTVAEKTVMTVRTAGGTQEQPVPAEKRKLRALSDVRAAELTGLGKKIEQVYGGPQDIEWCFADGQFHIVQVRPITTLPNRPVAWDAPGPGQWLHGGGTFEMITEPISPLFETFLFPIFYRTIAQMLADIGLEGALPEIPYRVVNGYIYLHMQMRLRPWHLLGVIKDFGLHLNSMQDQESEQALYREAVAALCQTDLSGLTDEQILARMQSLGEAGMRYWLQIMKIVQVIYRQEKAFTDFYAGRVRRPGDPEPEIFLRGQKMKPWEAECSSFDLAQLAQKHPPVADALRANPETAIAALKTLPDGKEFLAALEAHLDRYGHQLSSFDLSLPTLVDDPRPVLTAIRAFLNGKESPYARQQRMTAEREQAAQAAGRLSARDRQKFERLLAVAQSAAAVRENALFDVGLAWTPMHRCALELGRRLAQANVIAQSGDVFCLNLDEIRAALATPQSLAAKVAGRQADQDVWSKVNAPYLLPVTSKPAFWWGWIFPTPELQRHPDAHTLIGLGVSPGKVTAVARVIHSLDEMQRINDGEILVTRTTTPAWTPLFSRIAGLVTDLGGPLAHGSIVAREYGIPAVMGVGSATQRIKDGQTITVDGAAGRVTLG